MTDYSSAREATIRALGDLSLGIEALEAAIRAEYEAAPAPDLLAAVEAYKHAHEQLDRSHSSHDRTVVIERLNDLANAALRSAPASREAGLDAERLARALHAFYAGKDTRYEFFPADCEHPEDARIIAVAYASDDPNDAIAAEYARLAASPVMEEPS